VSATTGALKPVVVKLATLMGDEHKSLKGVHVEIKLLALHPSYGRRLGQSALAIVCAFSCVGVGGCRKAAPDVEKRLGSNQPTIHPPSPAENKSCVVAVAAVRDA
jgi:hypothetical protein